MKRGQAALEYLLVLTALIAVTAATGWLVHAARRASERTTALVGSDYP